MNPLILIKALGSLVPVLFPKQEFKPKRAIGAVLAIVLAFGATKFLDEGEIDTVLDTAEQIIELTEE